MLRSRKLLSMPIISLEEGISVGIVRNLVINPEKMEVAALVMNQRGWLSEQKIVPYAKVRSVGNDVITIEQSSNIQKIVKHSDLVKLVRQKADPIATKVVTENGTILGLVDEYYIDETTGKIDKLEISGKFLENLFKGRALMSCNYIRTMGSDIIIVKESTELNLEKIEGGLQETFNSLKQNTTQLWESTKQRTKNISKNLKDKYDKKETAPSPGTAGEVTVKNEEIIDEVIEAQPPEQSEQQEEVLDINPAEKNKTSDEEEASK